MSLIAAAPKPEEAPLPHHPFWPAIQPKHFRAVMALDGTVTTARLEHALTEAVVTVNRELRDWRLNHENAGTTALAELCDAEELTHLYQRAIYCMAKADIMERLINFDSTALGQKRAEAQETGIDDMRRDARWAIRDIRGENRTSVFLI